ncbi:MAG: tetratricopeptide repeat protein, partial [Proteobacteria bacterium]|nr:tetratricopeptide repeat protein [Pseudomonadota bacterium]
MDKGIPYNPPMSWAVKLFVAFTLALAGEAQNPETAEAALPAQPRFGDLAQMEPDPEAIAYIGEMFEEARRKPTDAAARGNLALVYHGFRLYHQAAETYRQALYLDPDHAR